MLLTALFLLSQLVLSVRTELVAVPVTVTDADGNHVPDLAQEHFRVFEDGRLQPITLFHRGDIPVTIGLVVDRSQSMRGKGAALTAAVSTLLQSTRPDDELFAVTFHDSVALAQQGGEVFTNNLGALAAAASAISAGGRTALYDGVAAGLRQLELGHSQRTALVVVSDGGDNATLARFVSVTRATLKGTTRGSPLCDRGRCPPRHRIPCVASAMCRRSVKGCFQRSGV